MLILQSHLHLTWNKHNSKRWPMEMTSSWVFPTSKSTAQGSVMAMTHWKSQLMCLEWKDCQRTQSSLTNSSPDRQLMATTTNKMEFLFQKAQLTSLAHPHSNKLWKPTTSSSPPWPLSPWIWRLKCGFQSSTQTKLPRRSQSLSTTTFFDNPGSSGLNLSHATKQSLSQQNLTYWQLAHGWMQIWNWWFANGSHRISHCHLHMHYLADSINQCIWWPAVLMLTSWNNNSL